FFLPISPKRVIGLDRNDVGIMEGWNFGIVSGAVSVPSFHYSSIPIHRVPALDELTVSEFFHQNPCWTHIRRLRRTVSRRTRRRVQGGSGRLRQAAADDGAALYHALDHHEPGGAQLRSSQNTRFKSGGGS